MLGMHRHGELLGGTHAERLKRQRARVEHAATLDMEDAPAGSFRPVNTRAVDVAGTPPELS